MQSDFQNIKSASNDTLVEAILYKHNAATNSKRFNVLPGNSSINNAFEYYHLFKDIQKEKKAENLDYIHYAIRIRKFIN
ncbi:MAG: hypothetical protein ABI204_10135 [Ginsengibacter sp.]